MRKSLTTMVDVGIPPIPAAEPMRSDMPFLIPGGGKYMLGWERWSESSGDPGFVVATVSLLGTPNVVERFPLTEEGWATAWAAFARLQPRKTAKVRDELARHVAKFAEVAAYRGRVARPPDAMFPALGVRVRGDEVERMTFSGTEVLGPLAGAQAQLTDGSQAWSPGRAAFLPLSLTGLATKTKAAAFVIFPDGSYHKQPLDGNKAVRDAQSEALRFNLVASPPGAAQPAPDDTAATLRKLASLHDEGLLSDEEYAAKRTEVIARI
jgi:hypothetical protein